MKATLPVDFILWISKIWVNLAISTKLDLNYLIQFELSWCVQECKMGIVQDEGNSQLQRRKE